MKEYLCFLIFTLLLSCEATKQEDASNNIYINVDHVAGQIDISSLFLPSVEFVSLETSKDVLISDIEKIIVEDGNIYISDRYSQRLLVFNSQGDFLRSIGKRGVGPEEYSALGDFVVSGDSVFIQDKFQDKMLIYNTDGKYLSQIMFNDIYYVSFLKKDNILYFLSSYERLGYGYYNFIAYNMENEKYEYYLPFKEGTTTSWGLTNYFSSYDDETFLIQAGDNNIYEITSDTPFPKWTVHFSKDEIPDELKQKGVLSIVEEALNKGYIKGIDEIRHSPDHLFLSYSHGDRSRNVLYNRHTHKVDICQWMVIDDLGGLYVTDFVITSEGDFFIIQSASMFKNAWENIYKKNKFKSQENKEKMEMLFNSISDDSNPVNIKLKLNN